MRTKFFFAFAIAGSIAATMAACAGVDANDGLEAGAEPTADPTSGDLHPLDGVLRPDGATEASDAKAEQASSCSFSPNHADSPAFLFLALPLLLRRRRRANGSEQPRLA